MTEKDFATRRHALEAELADLDRKIAEQRAEYEFDCVCGARHKINACTAIQHHDYTRLSGYSGGDYWTAGELWIQCPDYPERANRLLFDQSNIPYSILDRYDYNVEKQFCRLYTPLFKEVIQRHDRHPSNAHDNCYFDAHREQFGLSSEPVVD